MMESQPTAATVQEAAEAEAEAAVVHVLEHVDKCLELREAATAKLKDGWFDIARARHAMGRQQVTEAMYSANMQPVATVHLRDEPRAAARRQTADSGDRHTAASVAADSQPATTASSTGSSLEPNASAAAAAISHSSDAGKLSQDLAAWAPLDSGGLAWSLESGDASKFLHMFGAAPSPYLRSAQASFKQALEELVGLANCQQALRPNCPSLTQ